MDAKSIALSTVFAALYAVAVVLLSVISFGIVQLRVADALIPLSALFGWPAVVGVTLGCLIGNAYAPVGWPDYLMGPLANLAAGYIIFRLRRRVQLGCAMSAVTIGVMVGGYLWLFLPVPSLFGLEQTLPWLVSVLSISLSSLVTLNLLGYWLFKILSKPNIIGPLRSYGLNVYVHEG